MSTFRPLHGDLYDCRRIPVRPGDLLRCRLYSNQRGRNYDLYHVVVFEGGRLWAVPVHYLEPTMARGGGKHPLTQEITKRYGMEIVYSHSPDGDYRDRPKCKKGIPARE